MIKQCASLGAIGVLMAFMFPAAAQDTVECRSRNYQYDECWAGSLRRPQLVHQLSSNACIVNRTWGYNRRSGYIWVANGCAGVFADVHGYHHGRGDTYDDGSRYYDQHGNDAGAVVAGAVIGAILGDALGSSHKHHRHSTSNVHHYPPPLFTACHGPGCAVDHKGNPNFNEKGEWQGCHGNKCLSEDHGD